MITKKEDTTTILLDRVEAFLDEVHESTSQLNFTDRYNWSSRSKTLIDAIQRFRGEHED